MNGAGAAPVPLDSGCDNTIWWFSARDLEEVSIYMRFSKPTLLRFHETTLNHDVGGGFKHFFCSPGNWGNDLIWRAHYSTGLVQPPRFGCREVCVPPWKWTNSLPEIRDHFLKENFFFQSSVFRGCNSGCDLLWHWWRCLAAFLPSWWYMCKLFQVAFFTDPYGKKTRSSQLLWWSKVPMNETDIWSLPQNSDILEDHWANSQLCIYPWTPNPWKMKVLHRYTPNIWVITPKNEGCGFPWCRLSLFGVYFVILVLYCSLRYSTHCVGSSPWIFLQFCARFYLNLASTQGSS